MDKNTYIMSVRLDYHEQINFNLTTQSEVSSTDIVNRAAQDRQLRYIDIFDKY